MTNNLEAKNISKHFFHPEKTEILKDVSLSVKPSESVAIMGASGEGKTTLLHILGFLDKPDNGCVKISSEAVNFNNSSQVRNESIGFIFQDYNLLEDFTVLDNIIFPAKIGRKDLSKSILRANKYLEIVGLTKRKHFLSKFLSGGEKQRAAIARAFCNDPLIILADEPSGNLDYENSKIIHELLLSITKEENKSLIIATHDTKLASLCDKSFELKNGLLSPI